MLSRDARKEWMTILAAGLLLAVSAAVVGSWWALAAVVLVTAGLVAFFRDPERHVPTQRGVMVAPADGRVSSIHELDHFEPFEGPATCVRIFLSVLDVHINRSPCHGEVLSVTHKPGSHINALNHESAEQNESNLIVLVHPIRRQPVAAIRQIAGMLARTVTCTVRPEQVVQRGQRIGIIKLGSTTELYIPAQMKPRIVVQRGQRVAAGTTVLAHVTGREDEGPQNSSLGNQATKNESVAQVTAK